MKLQYGQVELDLLELHSYDRQNVYTPDGADLLFVRHRLNCTCVLSPGGAPHGLAAFKLTPPLVGTLHPADRKTAFKGAVPIQQPLYQYKGVDPFGGETAGVTDRVVVPLLLTPRQKLKLIGYRPADEEEAVESFVWLESPRPGYDCDSLNGPHPLGCSLVEATGDAPASGVLNFQIETHLPLAETDSARAIISHRWTTTITHDEDYYATRIISGEAVFDPSLLLKYNQSADAFISQLYHPIPLGYRRGLPDVTLASDGSKLTYVVTDTAVPCVFDPAGSGATQCWVDEEWKYISPRGMSGGDLAKLAGGVGGRAMKAARRVAEGKIGFWRGLYEGVNPFADQE